MPPRLNILSAGRSLAFRPKPSIVSQTPLHLRVVSRRGYADVKDPQGANQLPHVSEEAAAMGEITGETSPDLNQGTNVQEVRLTGRWGSEERNKR